jgi:hypothetical protein
MHRTTHRWSAAGCYDGLSFVPVHSPPALIAARIDPVPIVRSVVEGGDVRKIGLCAAAVLFAGGLVTVGAPEADATLCGSVGGRHVDVTGCADPLSYLNDALPPPPPPPAAPPPPPPPGAPPPPPPPPPPVYVPPAPNVDVCANVGRRVSVTGCI